MIIQDHGTERVATDRQDPAKGITGGIQVGLFLQDRLEIAAAMAHRIVIKETRTPGLDESARLEGMKSRQR